MKRIVPSMLGVSLAVVVACSSSPMARPLASSGDDSADASVDSGQPASAFDASVAEDAIATGSDGSLDAVDGSNGADGALPEDASADDASGDGATDVSSDAGADADASPTIDAGVTPSSVTITGHYTVNCTEQPSGTELDCNLAITSLASTPPPPAGMTVSQAVQIMNENDEAPAAGYRGGLSVTMPSYPDSCLQVLSWYGDPTLGFAYTISSNTQSGQSCGTTSAPAQSDFSGGFTASAIATWAPTGSTVPATITLVTP